VAGRVWVSLAVGSQLGSQFGYPAVTRNRRNAAARRRPSGDRRNAKDSGRLHLQRLGTTYVQAELWCVLSSAVVRKQTT